MRAQLECDEGSAFLVWSPEGGELDASSVIGRKKCCWSRSAPILYSKLKFRCNNPLQLPEVFHGSQWGSLHHSLVEHIMRHPVSQAIVSGMENTLLPDEALLQTLAVNSPFRKTLIANHLRFIEWSAPAPTHPPPHTEAITHAIDGSTMPHPASIKHAHQLLMPQATAARRREQVLGISRSSVPWGTDGAQREFASR
mgnify:CR=1 FL=1